jgi:hypothetical protein
MHYHNATCFGHIRPSSGNTFIRSLMHCALIEYHSFRYVVSVFFFLSFLKCGCFCISLVCCFLDCVYQVSLYVLCIPDSSMSNWEAHATLQLMDVRDCLWILNPLMNILFIHFFRKSLNVKSLLHSLELLRFLIQLRFGIAVPCKHMLMRLVNFSHIVSVHIYLWRTTQTLISTLYGSTE